VRAAKASCLKSQNDCAITLEGYRDRLWTYSIRKCTRIVTFQYSRQRIRDVSRALEDNHGIDFGVVEPGLRDQAAVENVFHDTLQVEERIGEARVGPFTADDVGIELCETAVRAAENLCHVGLCDFLPATDKGAEDTGDVILGVDLALDPAEVSFVSVIEKSDRLTQAERPLREPRC